MIDCILALILCLGIGTAQVAPNVVTTDEDRFVLVVESPKDIEKGKKVIAKIKVAPKGEWHMNMEYPVSLTVTPGKNVKVFKSKQAIVLDEHNGIEFDMGFTALGVGPGTIEAKLKFAICIESACSSVTEEFKIEFEAK